MHTHTPLHLTEEAVGVVHVWGHGGRQGSRVPVDVTEGLHAVGTRGARRSRSFQIRYAGGWRFVIFKFHFKISLPAIFRRCSSISF